MELVSALVISILFGCGFYLTLQKGLLNRALGLLLISHGAILTIMCMAGLSSSPHPPLLPSNPSIIYADPLPQALILTALVIGFAVAAYLWALVLRLGKEDPS